MSISCTLPQYSNHFVSSVSPYLESSRPQYISPPPSSIMDQQTVHPDAKRMSPQRTVPSSPSSTGEHRVSKAKKGKRVHACEFPGCHKIFTRAEHRRRHELSHKSRKLYDCTHPGCSKAFHRADYLAQHIARHDPNYSKDKSSSSTKNVLSPVPMTSVPLSGARSTQSFQAKSSAPISQGFQHVESNGSATSPDSTDSALVPCSQCFGCQNNQGCINAGPFYSYSNTMSHGSISSVSSVPLFAPQSPHSPLPSSGLDSVIDQYLRSVLKPEAFITPPPPLESLQQEDPIDPSFWNSNIDPNLPSLNPSIFHTPASYSAWSASSENISPHMQPSQIARPLTRDATL